MIDHLYVNSSPVQFLLKCSEIEDTIRSIGGKGLLLVTSREKTLINGYASCRKENPRAKMCRYEIWQQGPAGMQEALFQVVRAAVRNRKTSTELEGASVKLLYKKAGEEGILEHIRPICLMQTAAKIVTAIWAHRLGLAQLKEGWRVHNRASGGTDPLRDKQCTCLAA